MFKPSHQRKGSVGSSVLRIHAALTPVAEALEGRCFLHAGHELGDGLIGRYYDNADFTNPKVTRTDAVVDFYWDGGSPAASIGADTFSARWTGQLETPTTETYTFTVRADDGVRLWINDQLIIDKFASQGGMVDNVGSISLVHGERYDVRLDYFEGYGRAGVKLQWQTPTIAKQVVPTDYLFDGLDPVAPVAPAALAAAAKSSAQIALNWTDSSDNETGFEIQRSADGVTFAALLSVPANTITFTDAGLTASTTYAYRVRAINGTGESAWSNVATAKTNAVAAPIPPTLPAALRINAGGGVYTDQAGRVWSAEIGFTGGTRSNGSFNVLSTDDDPLYIARRWGSMAFSTPVASGDYSLKLYFADPVYSKANGRLFNVDAEGSRVLSNFDIAAEAGGKTAFVKSIPLTIADGKLDLVFKSIKDNAIISAIELLPRDGGPIVPPPVVNAPSDAITRINWTTVAAAPIPRAEALHAVVDGKLYVFAGFSGDAGPVTRADVYDPGANTWRRIADMPRRLSHAGTASDGRSVYFAGGYIGIGPGFAQQFGTKEVWRYDVDADAYTRMPDLPAARGSGSLVVLGRELHFVGGNNSNRQDVGDHYVLNLDGGTSWRLAAPLPNPRSHFGAVALSGRIYTVGGQHGNDEALVPQNSVEVYDPTTDCWASAAPLPRTINHIASATTVVNGRILTLGGQINHGESISDVFAYDPAANAWTALTPLPGKRFSGVAAVIDGVIYFTGGSGLTTTWKGTPTV